MSAARCGLRAHKVRVSLRAAGDGGEAARGGLHEGPANALADIGRRENGRDHERGCDLHHSLCDRVAGDEN